MTIRYVLLHEIPGQTRDVVRLHGPDTQRFLQGSVSANVEPIPAGQAVATGLLTVKGKLVSEMIVLADGDDGVRLLVPESLGAEVAALLDRHIIMDEVEVEHQGRATVAFAWTPDEGEVSIRAGGDVEVLQTRHPAPGKLVLGSADAVASALGDATPADAIAFDAYRVATASPAWGRESGPDHFPPEVGFVYAVSYDKGCYMGQEPLARIHARGQVNWVMVRVEADGDPPREVVALQHPDRPEAGRWTTAVRQGDRTVGLAIVRRVFAKAGSVLHTGSEPAAEVRITSGPLGDDAGIGAAKPATVKLGAR